MGAPVVWFEIAGRDLEAQTRFYEELFGWKVDAANPMNYGMVDTGADGGIPGGIYVAPEEVGEYVTFYVDVPDLEATLKQAEKRGAKVVQQPTDIGNGSRIALLDDPEGHRLGVIQQPPAATK